jgi:bifunctional ADP-heptose synthase (sugar kinase/adenylyltransferase)
MALRDLIEELGVHMVVLTRGGEGISCLDSRDQLYHMPAFNRSEVFDVTGAGDTVISLLTLGLVAGSSLLEASQLANAAAGVVIRKQGNVTIQIDELQKELEKLGL